MTQLPFLSVGAYSAEVVVQNSKMDNLISIEEDIRDNESNFNHTKDESENVQRLHTLVFFYNKNGLCNVALTKGAFGDFVCLWIGIVSNCYVMHSHSRTSMLMPLCESDVFHLVQESDEEMGRDTVGIGNTLEK